ncbi:28S ribosomal protein S9, mitochondrial [Lingula anatina]|uniref:28S ribosomal protein S9, mitochondrial n=1 Tax=Lingula anatina TaxID=7574 RepID=A0A1S3JTY8_LINAN|nr:28S ribosomal protein S9, mitochondrial [Lingula anatina]|eukprot:XP_013413544.1 28S ribosomal protein S9, mitochondrial [Lingula anatina]
MAATREVALLVGQIHKHKPLIRCSLIIQKYCMCTGSQQPQLTHREVQRSGGIVTNKYGEPLAVELVLPKPSLKNYCADFEEELKQHEIKYAHQLAQYKKARGHLQNIIGLKQMSTLNRNRSLKNLFPSGLFEPKARPMFRKPFLKPIRSSVRTDGRPSHYLFYTSKPRYYEVMNAIALKLEHIQRYEEFMVSQGISKPSSEAMMSWADGGRPMTLKTFQKKCGHISTQDYLRFVLLLQKTVVQPYSYIHRDWINQFRRFFDRTRPPKDKKEPKIHVDEKGRQYSVAEGKKKTSLARVKLFVKGTGEVTVNGKPMVAYFPKALDREQLLSPLDVTKKLTTTDVEAEAILGGHRSQARAIRIALSKCLTVFVSEEEREMLRLAGLFKRDSRIRERKKPGQKKARKKHTWKRR